MKLTWRWVNTLIKNYASKKICNLPKKKRKIKFNRN